MDFTVSPAAFRAHPATNRDEGVCVNKSNLISGSIDTTDKVFIDDSRNQMQICGKLWKSTYVSIVLHYLNEKTGISES